MSIRHVRLSKSLYPFKVNDKKLQRQENLRKNLLIHTDIWREKAFLSKPFLKKGLGTLFWLSVVRNAWFMVCSRRIVPATPTTFLGGSF